MVRKQSCQLNVRALAAGTSDGALQGTTAVGLYKDPFAPSIQQVCPDGVPAGVHSSRVPQEPLLHAQ